MAVRRSSIEQLLGVDKFVVDDDEAHIKLNKECCRSCRNKPCMYACPAGLYTLKDEEIQFDYAGCLECGTCRVVCPQSGVALTWAYPRGGFGIQFRYG
jgi:ferredoxin like protein